jgi:hypothetical protein
LAQPSRPTLFSTSTLFSADFVRVGIRNRDIAQRKSPEQKKTYDTPRSTGKSSGAEITGTEKNIRYAAEHWKVERSGNHRNRKKHTIRRGALESQAERESPEQKNLFSHCNSNAQYLLFHGPTCGRHALGTFTCVFFINHWLITKSNYLDGNQCTGGMGMQARTNA